jgi:hypothetical protein
VDENFTYHGVLASAFCVLRAGLAGQGKGIEREVLFRVVVTVGQDIMAFSKIGPMSAMRIAVRNFSDQKHVETEDSCNHD